MRTTCTRPSAPHGVAFHRRAGCLLLSVWRAPLPNPAAATVLWAVDYYLGVDFFDYCANVNGAPFMRTPSRRSG